MLDRTAKTIANELQDEGITKSLASLLKGLEKKSTLLRKAAKGFADKLAQNPANLAEIISWDCEDAIFSNCYEVMLRAILNSIASELDNRTKTLAQIMLEIRATRDFHIEKCLTGSEYKATSSSVMKNLVNVQKFRAHQAMSILMQSALDAFYQDLDDGCAHSVASFINDTPSC